MSEDSERDEFPFKQTSATQMLKDGLRRASVERGLSTRGAARELGYKATVVISHMATGRVPIPLERAAEIAEVVGIDKPSFYRAVLEQRYPGSAAILGHNGQLSPQSKLFADELELIAGVPLFELSDEHKRVLREVVAERSPARRWLSIPELPVVHLLRKVRPDMTEHGIPPDALSGIETFLEIVD